MIKQFKIDSLKDIKILYLWTYFPTKVFQWRHLEYLQIILVSHEQKLTFKTWRLYVDSFL